MGLTPSTLPSFALPSALCVRRLARLLRQWPVANVCPGHFTDAFEALPGVTFTEHIDRLGIRPQFAPGSHDFHREVRVCGERACTECYTILKPSEAVRARVDATLAELGPSYLSVHLRRTDHWGGPATDEEFVAFVAAHATTGRKVFLATDNADTQQKVRAAAERAGASVVTATRIVADRSKLRQTSLEDSAVDIFVAARADGPFKGTYSSSFSDTIYRLRELGGELGRSHKQDEHTLTDPHLQMAVTLHTPGGHKSHSPGCPMDSVRRHPQADDRMRDPVGAPPHRADTQARCRSLVCASSKQHGDPAHARFGRNPPPTAETTAGVADVGSAPTRVVGVGAGAVSVS